MGFDGLLFSIASVDRKMRQHDVADLADVACFVLI